MTYADNVGRELGKALASLEVLAAQGLSMASARALLWIAARSLRQGGSDSMNLTTLANELGMTVSGSHRLIASLRQNDEPLVDTDGVRQGARSGGLKLTARGEQVMQSYLACLSPDLKFKLTDVFKDQKQPIQLVRLISYDETTMEMEVEPASALDHHDLIAWMKANLSKLPLQRKFRDGTAKLKFASINEAIIFRMRWTS